MNDFLLTIVVPCYNEKENIPMLINRLEHTLLAYDYGIILVNDGSTDGTQGLIEGISQKNKRVKYLTFSRNFGHQRALKAGIDHATGDCIVTMDADLQHPPETILEMVDLWRKGFDVVTAVRQNSGHGSFFKRLASKLFYFLITKISDYKIEANGSDFRLIDRKIADILRQMPEQDLYIRGLVPWMGFKQAMIAYVEAERTFGPTKYSLGKMMGLAGNGITSSSIKPLRLALLTGLLFAFLAFGYGIYAVVVMAIGLTVPGWTSIVASIVLLSGIQLIVMGVMGEYLGKMYMENKHRPGYLVAKTNIKDNNRTTLKKERRAAVS